MLLMTELLWPVISIFSRLINVQVDYGLLCSTNTRTLVVSQSCSSFRDSSFATAGPQVWNSLPPNLRLCGLSYGQFRRLLKTFLFG